MYKQFKNIVPIYNIIFYVWCSWGCGVCVGPGRLGVCGSAVVPPLWRLGGFGAVILYLETLLSLEVKGSSEGILYDEIYIFCMCI